MNRPVAKRLIASVGACLAVTAATGRAALAQPRFDHTAQIESVLGKLGGGRDIARATDAQLGQLWEHLTSRGQFLLDLYALDRELLAAFASQRDSIARTTGVAGPGTAFFLARAHQELGHDREASAAYGRVGSPSPARLRSEAAAWMSVLAGRGGDSWQQALTDWRAGKAVTPRSCSPNAPTVCPLFQAVVGGDIQNILRLQRDALRRTEADYADTLKGTAGTFTVEYHDPALLYVMAIADFVVAARILEGRPNLGAYRGIALLRAARAREAQPLLDVASSSSIPLAVFRGEALAAAGNRTAAEQVWRTVQGAPTLNLLADSRSAVGLDGGSALRQFNEESRRQFQALRTPANFGTNLGRALLRVGKWEEALATLRAVRPLSVTPSADRVPPLVPVLTAHALFQMGRTSNEQTRRNDAVAELQAVAAIGGASRTFRLLQRVSVPKSGSGEVR